MRNSELEKFKSGDHVWINGVDANNNKTIYYQCSIVEVVNESFIVDPLEDSIFEPENRCIVMFDKIDKIGLIT